MLLSVGFLDSTGVASVALRKMIWSDLVSIKLSQNCTFQKLLVLANKSLLNFHKFEKKQRRFFGFKMSFGKKIMVSGCTYFLILAVIFLKYVFLGVHP